MHKRIRELLQQAIKEFEKINHWRGLYMSYRHLHSLHEQSDIGSEVLSDATNAAKTELNFYSE